MIIILNIVSLAIVLIVAGHHGWLGETIQFKMLNFGDVNEQYDRELLLAIALVQAGKGVATFNDDGFIHISTENTDFTVYAHDYSDAKFGVCYLYKKNHCTSRRHGILSLRTRKYLLEFKEEHLGIRDPSGINKSLFGFKKEKITIK